MTTPAAKTRAPTLRCLLLAATVSLATAPLALGQALPRGGALELSHALEVEPVEGRLELDVTGPLGDVGRTFSVRTRRGEAVSALEALPSLLILLVALGGGVLLFLPLPRRKEDPENAETDPHRSADPV